MRFVRKSNIGCIWLIAASAFAQQMPDTTSLPTIPNPAFEPANGPLILIDEAHNNFHTAIQI